MNKILLSALVIASTLFISCKKEKIEEIVVPNPTTINVMLETLVGKTRVAKNVEYISTKDTFSITELKYFLSNLTFVNTTTNQKKKINGSYILFDAEKGAVKNASFTIKEAFTFDKVEISFGVDSTANKDFYNTSGDLQPGGQDGMAWSWKTGYKFIKFEGKTKSGNFIQHIGTNVNYTTIQLPVSGTIEPVGNYTIHFQADILALLNGHHHKVDLDSKAGHGGHSSKHPIAQNAKMNFLSIHHFSGGKIHVGDGHHH